MLDWQSLVRLSNEELERLDIAAVNLACAVGLPGSDRIDEDRCLKTLDRWADGCRWFTDRVMYAFRRGECDYADSEPRFRIQAMITHLQRDLGVRYHPGRIDPATVMQPEDSFIHGVIQGEGGTCCSMPIIYTAVGRRMGYPIQLSSTKGHGFCQWVTDSERFNIEAAGQGISFYEDEHYRTGKYAMDAEQVKRCGYIEPLNARETLASFLLQRGLCWVQEKNYNEAVTAMAWANEIDPRRWQHGFCILETMRKWDEQLRSELPREFPKLDLGLPASQFLKMPREVEQNIIGLRVTEQLFRDPQLDRKWWSRLRNNVRPHDLPTTLRIDYRWNRPGHAATA